MPKVYDEMQEKIEISQRLANAFAAMTPEQVADALLAFLAQPGVYLRPEIRKQIVAGEHPVWNRPALVEAIRADKARDVPDGEYTEILHFARLQGEEGEEARVRLVRRFLMHLELQKKRTSHALVWLALFALAFLYLAPKKPRFSRSGSTLPAT